jgi:hypothetical protein
MRSSSPPASGSDARPSLAVTLAVTLQLLCATSLLAAGEDTAPPARRSRLGELLLQRFPFEPPKPEASNGTPRAAEGAIVLLPEFEVVGTAPRVDRVIAEAQMKLKREAFSWRDGGTILRLRGRYVTTELKFRYNPARDKIDLLSFSW